MKMVSLGFFLLIWLSAASYALTGLERAKTVLSRPTAQSSFRFILQSEFEPQRGPGRSASAASGTKSVRKAVLFSAVVPGSGEIYVGSYIKGVAFLVIEAASLSGHFYYQNRGDDLEREFEFHADQNWFEDDYWDWMARISGISRTDMDGLRAYEHENFSHFLPEMKNQQYYENIGKYDQFNIGWQDTQNGGARDSDLREEYTIKRKHANDNFKRATSLITVALLNHVVSALDAGLTTKRLNGKTMNLRMNGMYYNDEVVPALTVGVEW